MLLLFCFVPVSLKCTDSLTVSVQPTFALACIKTGSASLKIPNTGSHANVCTSEFLQALTGMGSAALAAAVHYPGKATRNSARDKEVINQINSNAGKCMKMKCVVPVFVYSLFDRMHEKRIPPHNRLSLLSSDVTVANTSARQLRTVSHTSSH